jgi:hypothetical protein
MSAFICSDNTFGRIYIGFKRFNFTENPFTQKAIEDLLQYAEKDSTKDREAAAISQLYALNVEAINQRYGDGTKPIIGKRQLNQICGLWCFTSIGQFLKSLECLRYQMSEGDVPESELYKLVSQLIEALYLDSANLTDMYKGAYWD